MKEQAKCPICGKRLFDIEHYLIGDMEIKCSQCRHVVKLEFQVEVIKCKSEAKAKESDRAESEAILPTK